MDQKQLLFSQMLGKMRSGEALLSKHYFKSRWLQAYLNLCVLAPLPSSLSFLLSLVCVQYVFLWFHRCVDAQNVCEGQRYSSDTFLRCYLPLDLGLLVR